MKTIYFRGNYKIIIFHKSIYEIIKSLLKLNNVKIFKNGYKSSPDPWVL